MYSNLPCDKRLLVVAPAASSHRAAITMWPLIRGCCMIERCQHSITHCIQVVRVGTHCFTVVGSECQDGSLLQLAMASSSQRHTILLPGGCQFPERSAESFCDVVYALLLLQFYVVAVDVQVAQMLIRPGITV